MVVATGVEGVWRARGLSKMLMESGQLSDPPTHPSALTQLLLLFSRSCMISNLLSFPSVTKLFVQELIVRTLLPPLSCARYILISQIIIVAYIIP